LNINLLHLSESNLRDRLTVQNFVHNYKLKDKGLLILDSFGDTLKDTRFVARRLSSLLSEAMVYNMSFTADQRDFFYEEGGKICADRDKISKLLETVQLLVMAPVIKGADGQAKLVDPAGLIEAAREAFGVEELRVFIDNPMSPLGNKQIPVTSEADIAPHLKVYEEERPALERALKLQPTLLCGSANYGEENE
jgi:hypothetical protein